MTPDTKTLPVVAIMFASVLRGGPITPDVRRRTPVFHARQDDRF